MKIDQSTAGKLMEIALQATSNNSIPETWAPIEAEKITNLIPEIQIEELIGRGGMGTVYLGTQIGLNRKVAVKILPSHLNNNVEFQERFKREAKTLASLNNVHLIQLFSFGQTKAGQFYIVMEYVEGDTLRTLLNADNYDYQEILFFIIQIGRALEAVHQTGLIHRDVKPENILVSKRGIIKLGDFGLAKNSSINKGDLTFHTETGYAVGTPSYVAPEQISDGIIDFRTDIFSLGVIIYEWLTGEIPRGAAAKPSDFNQHFPKDLDSIIFKAIQSNPDKRYQSVGKLIKDLESILNQKPIDKKTKQKSSLLSKSAKHLIPLTLLPIMVGIAILSHYTKKQNQDKNKALVETKPSANTPFTHYLMQPPNLSKWNIIKGEWIIKENIIKGSGNSQIEFPIAVKAPFTVNFDIKITEGLRPRVKIRDIFFANEGYERSFGLHPRTELDIRNPPTPYKINTSYNIELRIEEDHTDLFIEDQNIERILIRTTRINQLILMAGDSWSPGSTEFSNLKISKP